MPRKSRKKVPSTEPTPVSEILEKSPAVAAILASRDARAEVEPDQPMAEQEAVAAFQRQREREQAGSPSMETVVTEALVESHKPTHTQRLKGLRPAPSGFVGLEGHYAAGIRLSRSLDKQTVAIQFADDHRPSKDGLNPESQQLSHRGFTYKPERAQWERKDREWPAENYQDAKQFVATLVKERLAGAEAERTR